MERFGWVGKLRADAVDKYVALHADAWPAVLRCNTECHLQNYSIFLTKMPHGEHVVFSYLEYTGEDFTADMNRMAANPEIQRWWAECKPCFEQIDALPPGEVWAPMETIFYQP